MSFGSTHYFDVSGLPEIEIRAEVFVDHPRFQPATFFEPAEGGPEFQDVVYTLLEHGKEKRTLGEAEALSLIDHELVRSYPLWRDHLVALNLQAYEDERIYLAELYHNL